MKIPQLQSCAVYKSAKKADYYLFVEHRDDFNRVPHNLLSMLGRLEFVMTLDLHARRKLAQSDTPQVMRALQTQGYYLQLPPKAYLPTG